MCNIRKKFLLFLTLFWLPFLCIAQNDINSPYSSFGVGNLSPRTNGISTAMGGCGYALQNPYYINFKNPASYIAFDSLSFIADLSFNLVSHKLRTELQQQSGTFAQLSYLTIGLSGKSTRHAVTTAINACYDHYYFFAGLAVGKYRRHGKTR